MRTSIASDQRPADEVRRPAERLLTWRGLAWVAARQHRTALITCGVVYAITALLLVVNGALMHASYEHLGLAGCGRPATTFACQAGVAQFTLDYAIWVHLVPVYLLIIPLLTGVFAGSPALGQDLDTGAFRFAWTQGAGRARLLTVKLALLGGLLIAASAAITVLARWWFKGASVLGADTIRPQFFPWLGPAYAAWALFAFALALAAGAVLRRVVPAIATALAGSILLAVTTGIWLRYHLYRAPLRFSESLGHAAGPATGPAHRYIISTWLEGRSGQILQRVPAVLTGPKPPKAGHAGPAGLPGPLALRGVRLAGLYQPQSRFWPFQWTETGWLVVLSVLLLAAGFYLSRRPHAVGLGLRRGAAAVQAPAVHAVTAPAVPAGTPDSRLYRSLTCPRLAWVAWRQHRTALRGCAVLFAAAGLLLLINGLAMRSRWTSSA